MRRTRLVNKSGSCRNDTKILTPESGEGSNENLRQPYIGCGVSNTRYGGVTYEDKYKKIDSKVPFRPTGICQN